YVVDMGGSNEINGQLWEMSTSGTGAFQLTNTLQDDEEPTFLPDGSAIIFTRAIGNGREIYSMPAAGGAATALTSDGANASSPITGW
ncbi:MAG TPA: hypothetical protein VMI31_11395, partial [Fimbriimonadaceae bacterium]|nr:hypothetical protein [Fimbriimonadaceae bacterium]